MDRSLLGSICLLRSKTSLSRRDRAGASRCRRASRDGARHLLAEGSWLCPGSGGAACRRAAGCARSSSSAGPCACRACAPPTRSPSANLPTRGPAGAHLEDERLNLGGGLVRHRRRGAGRRGRQGLVVRVVPPTPLEHPAVRCDAAPPRPPRPSRPPGPGAPPIAATAPRYPSLLPSLPPRSCGEGWPRVSALDSLTDVLLS